MTFSDDARQIIDEYFRKLTALIATFNFTRQGHQESMGKDAAGIVAQGIIDRSVNDQGGPTGIWLANDPDYTVDKVAKYNVSLIGFRTGQMISLPSLLGKLDITPDEVLIHYGTSKAPTSSMASNYLSKGDQDVTDNQKAQYFTEKKGPFFALDDKIADEVHKYFEHELGLFIGELNAR
jgi:hypothetical protein